MHLTTRKTTAYQQLMGKW